MQGNTLRNILVSEKTVLVAVTNMTKSPKMLFLYLCKGTSSFALQFKVLPNHY